MVDQKITLPRVKNIPNYSPWNVNVWVLLFGVPVISIMIFPTAYDPFNAPKQYILALVGAWLLGTLIFDFYRILTEATLKLTLALGGLLSLVLILDYLIGSAKITSFFGDDRRNSGLLTYLLLIIVFLTAATMVRQYLIQFIEYVVLIAGFVIAGYGFLQYIGHDWIHWNNQYNSIISWLGNPDFASAVMGILAAITFGIAFNSGRNIILRVLAGLNTLFLLYISYESQARQGWIIALGGIGLILLIWIYQKHKLLGQIFTGLGFVGVFFIIAGMLQIGPLSSFLYKTSVTYRGDYWRAAWRMFLSHPIFGVGLDRYGYYFQQYRDATQSLRRGPLLLSNATHNVPLQLTATGGLVLIIPYLIFTFYTGYRAYKAIKQSSGAMQIAITGIVAGWLTYEMQSIISIDNIGIVVWGWFFGGAIIGLSLINQKSPHVIGKNNHKRSLAQTHGSTTIVFQCFASIVLVIIAVLVINPQLQDAKSVQYYLSVQPNSTQYGLAENGIVNQIKNRKFTEYYVAQYTDQLFRLEINDQATLQSTPRNQIQSAPYFKKDFEILDKLITSDPQYVQVYLNYASYVETLAQYELKIGAKENGLMLYQKATSLREHLLTIDPWNYSSEYALIEDLKFLGQSGKAKGLAINMVKYIDAHWKDSRVGSTLNSYPNEYLQAKKEFNI